MIADLRSDTVTRPTPGMLAAMMAAEVGDDVFGEDPTVNALERKAAAMFGKEAGLFCPSGTMTNQLAINAQCGHLDQIICDESSHIYNYETGAYAYVSRVTVRPVRGDRGRFTPQDIIDNINPDHDWLSSTRMVCIENSCNRGGGSYYTLGQMAALCHTARQYGLKTHLDGARIFNVIVETGDTPEAIGQYFDTVSICLSKGLGAPAGSLLLGSREVIKTARRLRKALGGGMRQAGYLAAAGIYALDNHIERLREDHQRAKEIEKALHAMAYVEEVLPVETNIIIFKLRHDMPAGDFLRKLENRGVLAVPFGHQTIRMVTHLDIDDDRLSLTIDTLKSIS